jgi:hypothetical protein
MQKDFSRSTLYFNWYQWSNFSLGIDFYQVYRDDTSMKIATVFQLNFLLFNITFTRWDKAF